MASIYTLDGNELAAGLQGCNTCDEAVHAAERHADALGTDVHLVDDDGEWIVHPSIGGTREPADALADALAEKRMAELEEQAQAQGGLSRAEQEEYARLRTL